MRKWRTPLADEIEKDLKTYKHIESFIKDTKRQIKSLDEIEISLSSCSYSGCNSKNFDIYSRVENDVIRIAEEKEILTNRLKFAEIKKEQLDNRLDALDDEQRKIIEMNYFKKKSIEFIAEALYISERTARNRKADAFRIMCARAKGDNKLYRQPISK